MKKCIIFILMLGWVSMLSAKPHGTVFSPEAGVICDKKSGFCSDSYGISLGITKEVLGEKAALKWEKILKSKDFDATSYTMSNGLNCDTKKKICKKSKWDDNADPHWTKILFGQ
jgi:hypothetical protein